jgi:peroxiredoxin Q/BCP
MTKPLVGENAPDFEEKDQTGKKHRLADYKGKILALYFYPKDLTPGCTLQACNLRNNYALLHQNNIAILGISADDEVRHQKFIDKYNLPFPLLADTDKKILNAYGVWGPKQFMGKKFDGIHRNTFIIDESGKVMAHIEKVKTTHHAQQILDAIQSQRK